MTLRRVAASSQRFLALTLMPEQDAGAGSEPWALLWASERVARDQLNLNFKKGNIEQGFRVDGG